MNGTRNDCIYSNNGYNINTGYKFLSILYTAMLMMVVIIISIRTATAVRIVLERLRLIFYKFIFYKL